MSERRPASTLLPAPIGRDVLSRFTEARVALGRAGCALPTKAHLAFVGDHARARDAVWTAVDFDAVAESLDALGLGVVRVRSEARDRATYLRRPDLGRRLDEASTAGLARVAAGGPSRTALVVADGLSAEAVQVHAASVAAALLPLLEAAGFGAGVAVLAEQGRVAIGDPVGETLGADVAVVLIGERPGLSAADSLGCYVTWKPRPGTPDSRRNCVSNIRRGGLDPVAAASRIAAIVRAAAAAGLSGVGLKVDDASPALSR